MGTWVVDAVLDDRADLVGTWVVDAVLDDRTDFDTEGDGVKLRVVCDVRETNGDGDDESVNVERAV